MIDTDAWLAGIYEGEGNLHHRKDGCWQITISMTDQDVVERVAAAAGCGNITVRRHSRYGERWTDQYAWRTGRRSDIAALLRRLRPYLGKRRGADADAFLSWHESGAAPVADPETRARAAARLRAWRAKQPPAA